MQFHEMVYLPKGGCSGDGDAQMIHMGGVNDSKDASGRLVEQECAEVKMMSAIQRKSEGTGNTLIDY